MVPCAIVTDRLASYAAVKAVVMPTALCAASVSSSANRSSVCCIDASGKSRRSCAAMAVSGCADGAKMRTGQSALPSIAPLFKAGTRPARTSDDLPVPDAPSTARNRDVFSFSTTPRVEPGIEAEAAELFSNRLDDGLVAAVVGEGHGEGPRLRNRGGRTWAHRWRSFSQNARSIRERAAPPERTFSSLPARDRARLDRRCVSSDRSCGALTTRAVSVAPSSPARLASGLR
jgi:hypothetical protein